MSDTTPALDEAFERMAAASFELPNGFVNHGVMACEALAALDCAGDIDSWARRFARAGGASVVPVVPAGFEWRQALGDYGRLPEWIGYFTRAIDGDDWRAVVAAWVPRLMPALRTALFHGAIRTAHAVRAIDAVDTPPRRGELARALGYWAACYRDGQPASPLAPAGPLPHAGDLRMAVVRAAAGGTRRYLARPGIVHLHGVTGAMAWRSSPPTSRPRTAPPRWPTCTPSTPRCTRPPNRSLSRTRPARQAASSPGQPCAAWTRTRSSSSRPASAGTRPPAIPPLPRPRKQSPACTPDRQPPARLTGSGDRRHRSAGGQGGHQRREECQRLLQFGPGQSPAASADCSATSPSPANAD